MELSWPDGLYEELVSNALERKLDSCSDEEVLRKSLDRADAPEVLTEYLAGILRNGMAIIGENENGLENQVNLANEIISLINSKIGGENSEAIHNPASILKALSCSSEAKKMRRSAKGIIRPETSIANSSLFTGAVREPTMASEIVKEIESSDQIDLVISFIRWSGVVLILDSLKKFTNSGKKLRIITTSYMGATELRAVADLATLNNTEIKISFDSERTRLHAKAYIFKRNTGFSTAYVGSSNLTNPAMTSGCEWNVKVTRKDLPDLFEKIEASFEGYWNSPDFEIYTKEKYDVLKEALLRQGMKNGEGLKRSFLFDIYPYPYQQAILDKLEAERKIHNSYKNLVVAATGTGKTMIAAFDYKQYCEKKGRKPNLLFVAHRMEILEQSIESFRAVLKEPEFAELFVGSYKPTQLNHIFISIDMLNQRNIWNTLEKGYYEYIVLDECHHSAAKSYKPIFDHFTPEVFLGLTATPERMDGESILKYFNDRIAAEIRLPEAINRKLLCPFQYFGVGDDADLSGLRWSRGGYEKSELENLYVFSHEIALKRAQGILDSIVRYVASVEAMKGLVFCVSKEHARFMAEFFNKNGIFSEYLTGDSSNNDRENARKRLQDGRTKLVCVVDLYNEGVDIKQINTVLFLRPTESLTIFLQQLGRGLRIAEGKDCLTVLDFIGQANKKYSFEAKFSALLQAQNKGLKNEVVDGFPHLPRGCFIRLEKKAQKYILDNITNSLSQRSGLIEKIKTFEEDTGKELSIENFAEHYNIPPREIYGQKCTFTNITKLTSNGDPEMWKKLFRLSTMDSDDFLKYWVENLASIQRLYFESLKPKEFMYWSQFYSCFIDGKPKSDEEVVVSLKKYFSYNFDYVKEVGSLLSFLEKRIDFISVCEELPFDNVLRVHCTYTRAQVLSSMGHWDTSSEGVARLEDKKTTCLFVTLNKSNSYYSPSTSYHDYSISSTLFHWQSQNSTSEKSSVGLRYINHIAQNENILLFVREAKEDKFGSIPFTFLGKVSYVSHNGNKPMSIIWRLKHSIPASFIHITDQLGVG